MRGARMGLLASMIAMVHGIAAPFRQAMALANRPPAPMPEFTGRRNKVRKSSHRPSGAAAQRRAAKKLRCARARAPKRKRS